MSACAGVAVIVAAAVLAFAQTKPAAGPAPAPSPTPVASSNSAASQAPAAPARHAVISAPTIAPPRPEYKFPLGLTYVYSVQWRIFDAGTATLRMEQAGPENRVVATADATGAFALLFHVQDRLEAFFDPATFCSHSIFRHTEEGFRRVEMGVSFDYQRGKSVLDQKNLKKKDSRHREHDIPGCVTDLLSAIYYGGSLPLRQGRTFTFPLNDGGETIMVNARVEGTEKIKTPAGTFTTFRVHPETSSGALRKKGRAWIWYADDASHTPVQMRARMRWGTLTLTLQKIEKEQTAAGSSEH